MTALINQLQIINQFVQNKVPALKFYFCRFVTDHWLYFILFLIIRFFPIRGADESMDLYDVLRVLRDHVSSAYPSFKEAFLKLNKV